MNPERIPDWWDPWSSQPYKIPAEQKPRVTAANLYEYLKVAATTLGLAPWVLWRYLTIQPHAAEPATATDFIGLSVTPDPKFDNAIREMVDDLGVRRLLLRIPCWESDRLEPYLDFMTRFPQHDFVVNILQSRDSVANPDIWEQQIQDIFSAMQSRVSDYQLGNAINRSKWGCRHSGDWLGLMDRAYAIAAKFDGAQVAGSSVIDFEPLVALRTLFNFHPHKFDICASLLYINRRGSPYGKQYRFFDLERKIRLTGAMLGVSNKCPRRLWITETNWPLLNTKPWTPNSGHPRSTVDEPTQARYLTQYYQIAWHSRLVERVYWWQLINPGYGLVDHRKGSLRKMPSYHAFGDLIKGDLYRNPTRNS